MLSLIRRAKILITFFVMLLFALASADDALGATLRIDYTKSFGRSGYLYELSATANINFEKTAIAVYERAVDTAHKAGRTLLWILTPTGEIVKEIDISMLLTTKVGMENQNVFVVRTMAATKEGGLIVFGDYLDHRPWTLKFNNNGELADVRPIPLSNSRMLVTKIISLTNEGAILGGHENGVPMVISVSSEGRIMWEKKYAEISGMVLDGLINSDGDILLLFGKRYAGIRQGEQESLWIQKCAKDGNEIKRMLLEASNGRILTLKGLGYLLAYSKVTDNVRELRLRAYTNMLDVLWDNKIDILDRQLGGHHISIQELLDGNFLIMSERGLNPYPLEVDKSGQPIQALWTEDIDPAINSELLAFDGTWQLIWSAIIMNEGQRTIQIMVRRFSIVN